MKYQVISYRNINSNGKSKQGKRVIEANSIRGAKMIASRIFPHKGKWVHLRGVNQYVKSSSVDMIGSDKLFVIPI